MPTGMGVARLPQQAPIGLPCAGSYGEQPAALMDAFAVLGAAQRAREDEAEA